MCWGELSNQNAFAIQEWNGGEVVGRNASLHKDVFFVVQMPVKTEADPVFIGEFKNGGLDGLNLFDL